MSEFISKKIAGAKIYRVSLIVLAILAAVSLAVGIINIDETPLFMIVFSVLTNVLWISGVLYVVLVRPFLGSVKRLKENGLEHIVDDINIATPTFPRSKIYCGQQAMYSKNPNLILMYADIAWVYPYERSVNGITVEKAIIVWTKEGRSHKIQANLDEFKELLRNYIIIHSPNVVIGFGKAQRTEYRQLNPQYRERVNALKRIWGIVLMCIGMTFSIFAMIFKPIEVIGVTIFIFALFIVGIILYLIGSKKQSQ